MSYNMSFFHTQAQIRNRTKTVTRRLGWDFLRPGDIINACVKCRGLKKGQKIEKICKIRIISNNQERLNNISAADVRKEGFEGWTVEEFIDYFVRELHVNNSFVLVNRIEFEYVT